jgi:signal transduction histidine kinase
VQEALHNVAKHAQARTATVEMDRRETLMRVVVEDDGQGMAKTTFNGRSFGLAGMRERVGSLGGSVRVTSSKGKARASKFMFPFSRLALPSPRRPIRFRCSPGEWP